MKKKLFAYSSPLMAFFLPAVIIAFPKEFTPLFSAFFLSVFTDFSVSILAEFFVLSPRFRAAKIRADFRQPVGICLIISVRGEKPALFCHYLPSLGMKFFY